MDKFEIQDLQYSSFPYHYIPHFDSNGIARISRVLEWGWDYLTYMTFIKSLIENELAVETILDVGCGDGYLINSLRRYKLKKGIDISNKAIQFAKAFSNDAIFEVMDVADETNQFDLVMLIEVIEHIRTTM